MSHDAHIESSYLFVARRAADAAARKQAGASTRGVAPTSIADVVRAQPKQAQNEWGGFKVVNKKKSRRFKLVSKKKESRLSFSDNLCLFLTTPSETPCSRTTDLPA
jgi:hypothetical protein